MKRIIPVLFIILLPLYLLLFSVEFTTFKLAKFDEHIEENSIEKATGKNKEELLSIFDDLLDYLKGENIDLSSNFNEREVRHMIDVELIYSRGFILKKFVFLILLGLIVYVIHRKAEILGILDLIFKGLFLWWAGIGAFFILAITDFTKYFTYFHELLFDNDLWILNPKTDLMIQMLPEVFFIKMFVRIVIIFMSLLFIVHLFIYLLRKYYRRVNYD